jgi:hypothetical protein
MILARVGAESSLSVVVWGNEFFKGCLSRRDAFPEGTPLARRGTDLMQRVSKIEG